MASVATGENEFLLSIFPFAEQTLRVTSLCWVCLLHCCYLLYFCSIQESFVLLSQNKKWHDKIYQLPLYLFELKLSSNIGLFNLLRIFSFGRFIKRGKEKRELECNEGKKCLT